jgi:hypothetical protein
MPDIQRLITLTSKGNSAGPSYRAQYSTDCVNYINTIGTSLINLPNVGSTATITYPDNAVCLRLVNQSVGCDNNFVIQVIGTTTTSTTTAATTTTSTTTAAPTTTTTTTAATTTTTTAATTTTSTTTAATTTTSTTLAPCYSGVVVQVTNGDALNWETCDGTSDGGFYPVGEHTIPGCIKPETIVGDGETTFEIISYGTPCTTTTTSTTTAAPTTTTTTAATTTTTTAATTTTTTAAPTCLCYTYTDDPLNVPETLNVRYRSCSTGDITTTPIDQLETVDNNDGTNTWYICVEQGSSYASPVCVVGGIEQTCPQAWIEGGSCTFNGDCAPIPSSVYYVLERCDDANIFYSIEYPSGTFDDRERVTATAGEITYTFIIIGELESNPGGGLLTITTTGFSECPTTTSTTTSGTTTTTTAAPTTTTTTSTSTSTTSTTTSALSATSVFGYMEPCVGGTIDDHMGASVNTNNPVSVDTEFGVDVQYVLPGNSCGFGESTESFTITIVSGSTSSNFDACNNGAFFSGGAVICSACITSCDNPAVNISAVSC